MATHQLDLTGKICPYCLLFVKKKLALVDPRDILIVICDHPPAATDTIPRAMKKAGNRVESMELTTGRWELTIHKT